MFLFVSKTFPLHTAASSQHLIGAGATNSFGNVSIFKTHEYLKPKGFSWAKSYKKLSARKIPSTRLTSPGAPRMFEIYQGIPTNADEVMGAPLRCFLKDVYFILQRFQSKLASR